MIILHTKQKFRAPRPETQRIREIQRVLEFHWAQEIHLQRIGTF